MSVSTKTIGFGLDQVLPASPERVWPVVSDTDAFNEAIGLPAWTFVERPDGLGGSIRIGSTRMLGTTLEWIENPFDWVVGQFFRVRRDYRTGPVRAVVTELRLSERGDGGTDLAYVVDAEPRGTLWKIVVRAELARLQASCRRAFDRLAAFYAGDVATPYPVTVPALGPEAVRLLSALESELPARGHDRELAARLVAALRDEPDRAVDRLNAVRLADSWNARRDAVLATLFDAARLGAVVPTWDMVCPLCRGAKHRVPAEDTLPARVHCPSCAADYDVLLDDSVELSFRPSRLLRAASDQSHCVGGPGNTRHILVQQGLDVGASGEASLPLAAGLYRLRSPHAKQSCLVRVGEVATADRLDVRVDPGALVTSAEALAAGPVALHFENHGAVGQLIELERIDGPAEAVTGLDAYRLRDAADLLAATIDCASFGVLVELAAAGTVGEVGQEALDRHMADCPPCTARFADDREALGRLALALEPRDAEPTPAFEGLLGRLDH